MQRRRAGCVERRQNRMPQYSGLELYRCRQCAFLFGAAARREEPARSSTAPRTSTTYAGRRDVRRRRGAAPLRGADPRRARAAILAGGPTPRGRRRGRALPRRSPASRASTLCGIEPARPEAERSRERLDVDVQAGFVEQADLGRAASTSPAPGTSSSTSPSPADALHRLRTALRPGGHLLLEVPNIESV